MLLVFGNSLLRSGGVLDATRTAVVGYVTGIGHNAALDNRAINVGGMDDGFIHMDYCCVVSKGSAAPLAAGKADASITEAVVHAAVVADVAAPIAVIKAVSAVVPAPIGRRPQRAHVGSWNPSSGDPVVVTIVI
jgi:hypothetical protein